MNKIGLIIISTLFCFLPILAQELQVKTFENVLTDVSASTNIRTDGNGDICSLVKVRLAEENASFEGNIVDEVSFKHGEYWVYMTAGSKNLLVLVEGFLPIDVKFPNYGIKALEGKQTYVLTLLASSKELEIKQELKIRVVPEDAIVLIDGDVVSLRKGIADVSLLVGSHSYNIAKEGYIKQMGEIRLFPDVPAKLIVELDKNSFSTESNSMDVTNPSDETSSLVTAQRKADFHNGHEFIDLGLSVKWAKCNIGAEKPEDSGKYFQWGDIIGYDEDEMWRHNTTWSTTPFNNGSSSFDSRYFATVSGDVCPNGVLAAEYDAASVNWEGEWRMPTKREIDELLKKCRWEWISSNGICGYKITSEKNGNFIFLPVNKRAEQGSYWSSSLGSPYSDDKRCAFTLDFNYFNSKKFYKKGGSFRFAQLSIRAVCP